MALCFSVSRACRRVACAEAPDERDLDVHLTHAGERALGVRPSGQHGKACERPLAHGPGDRAVRNDLRHERAWNVQFVQKVACELPARDVPLIVVLGVALSAVRLHLDQRGTVSGSRSRDRVPAPRT